MESTEYYNLNKPEADDVVDVTALNENADLIDLALHDNAVGVQEALDRSAEALAGIARAEDAARDALASAQSAAGYADNAAQSAQEALETASAAEESARQAAEDAQEASDFADSAASSAQTASSSAANAEEAAEQAALQARSAAIDAQNASASAAQAVEAVGELGGDLEDLRRDFDAYTSVISSWSDLQKVVRAGNASKFISIGDVFRCKRGNETLEWEVIGIDQDTPADNRFTHSLTLQIVDSAPLMIFDEREAAFYFPEGLAAGDYYFKTEKNPFASNPPVDVDATFYFSIALPVPSGGQIYFSGTYNKTLENTILRTFSSGESRVAIEEVTIHKASAGTVPAGSYLGEVLAETQSGNINSMRFALAGKNKYAESAVRQYINAKESAGNWWRPQNVFDRTFSKTFSEDGFLHDIDDDFLSALGTVVKKTKEASDIVQSEEKMFLLSASEVYGGEYAGDEGEAYSFYSENSSLSDPGVGADTNRIRRAGGTVETWWLRSPNKSASNLSSEAYVNKIGSIVTTSASGSAAVSPACCIV